MVVGGRVVKNFEKTKDIKMSLDNDQGLFTISVLGYDLGPQSTNEEVLYAQSSDWQTIRSVFNDLQFFFFGEIKEELPLTSDKMEF